MDGTEPERTMMRDEVSFSTLFADGLRGRPLDFRGGDDVRPLPTNQWAGPVDEVDRAMIARCQGPTLDIGCGPGRMTEALAESGRVVLGIDVVGEAVDQTRRRGAAAIRRDVFGLVPGEGRWGTALLADGNVGIGGDPVALLRRAGELLHRSGRVVAEVAEPGVETRSLWAVLESDSHRSRPFRWAVVGADAIESISADAGLQVRQLDRLGDRWCAVLGRVA